MSGCPGATPPHLLNAILSRYWTRECAPKVSNESESIERVVKISRAVSVSAREARVGAKKKPKRGTGLEELVYGNPRHSRVTFDRVAACFRVDGERVRGVCKTLKLACFPDYDYDKAKRDSGMPASMNEKTGLSGPGEGRNRGTLVHEQVTLMVRGGLAALQAREGRGAVPHPYVDRFLTELGKMGLEPVLCDWMDFYEGRNLASAVDLVCMAQNGDICLLEIKTGGQNYFNHGSGPLLAPQELTSYSNSPLTQAYLQLGFYVQMIKDNYPSIQLGRRHYVAQVNTEVTFFRLPVDFVSHGGSIVDSVLSA